MSFKLRRAMISDALQIWKWRNEPEDLIHSFNTSEISLESHVKWFKTNFYSPQHHFFIMEFNELPVGQIRIENKSFREGEIHITVGREYRSNGFAKSALALISDELTSININVLVAHVKPDNINSVITFIKSGFRFERLMKLKDVECYEFKRIVI